MDSSCQFISTKISWCWCGVSVAIHIIENSQSSTLNSNQTMRIFSCMNCLVGCVNGSPYQFGISLFTVFWMITYCLLLSQRIWVSSCLQVGLACYFWHLLEQFMMCRKSGRLQITFILEFPTFTASNDLVTFDVNIFQLQLLPCICRHIWQHSFFWVIIGSLHLYIWSFIQCCWYGDQANHVL